MAGYQQYHMALSNLSVEGPDIHSNFLEIMRTPANCLMLPEHLLCVSVLGLFAFSLHPRNHCETQVPLLQSVEKKTETQRGDVNVPKVIRSGEPQSRDLSPHLSDWRGLHFNRSAVWPLHKGGRG